jgi:hypothetical protein
MARTRGAAARRRAFAIDAAICIGQPRLKLVTAFAFLGGVLAFLQRAAGA